MKKLFLATIAALTFVLPGLASNFDEFDPDNFDADTFDPDNATGKPAPIRSGVVKPRTLANFTITIKNSSGSDQKVELFNYLRSYSEVTNTTLNSYNVLNAALVTTTAKPLAWNQNVIYFDTNGNLIQQNSSNAEEVKITCKQIPYASLFKASGLFSFNVEMTKISFANDLSLDQDITIFQNTFLGKVNSNPVTPRTYFKDNQFQAKQVTIPVRYTIDAERGLSLTVLAGETLTLNLFVSGYNKIATV